MVLVSRKDKIKIYTYLLKEGVFCFKKDYANKNENLDIPNLNCFLVIRSLASRKFVTEIFSWQWHYYCLTEKGVEYLRKYLGLPDSIIPNTHKFEEQPKEEENEENEEKEEKRERRGGRGRGRGRGGKRGGRTQQEGETPAQE